MNEFGKKTEQKLLAIIGDISRSREARDRAAMQRGLEKALATVNREKGETLVSSFVVTLGDEFQGLLLSPGSAVPVLTALGIAMEGIPARYGLGWGELTTPVKEQALGMDGPCFHHAREALLRGKKDGRWVTVRGFGDEEDLILNGIFRLMGEVRSRWTEKQARTVSQVRKASSQKDAAAALGVVPSVVSQALSAAGYIPMRDAEAALTVLFETFGKSTESIDNSAYKAK